MIPPVCAQYVCVKTDCVGCVTPREMGRKERESLQIMAEITKEGILLKQLLIHEAKRGEEDKQVSD